MCIFTALHQPAVSMQGFWRGWFLETHLRGKHVQVRAVRSRECNHVDLVDLYSIMMYHEYVPPGLLSFSKTSGKHHGKIFDSPSPRTKVASSQHRLPIVLYVQRWSWSCATNTKTAGGFLKDTKRGGKSWVNSSSCPKSWQICWCFFGHSKMNHLGWVY